MGRANGRLMNWIKHDRGDNCPCNPALAVEVLRRVKLDDLPNEVGPAGNFSWYVIKGKRHSDGKKVDCIAISDIIAYRPIYTTQ